MEITQKDIREIFEIPYETLDALAALDIIIKQGMGGYDGDKTLYLAQIRAVVYAANHLKETLDDETKKAAAAYLKVLITTEEDLLRFYRNFP